MCHELGHAHGRLHAPCNVSDPDPQFPYPDANIGVWGYDQRSGEFRDPTSKDMMSYCPEPRWSAWISDYNYQAILVRVAAVNGQPEVPAPFDASAAPESPPCSKPSRVSSRRPPSLRAARWQRTHELTRMGWTSRVKSSRETDDAAAGARADARTAPMLATTRTEPRTARLLRLAGDMAIV